MILHNWTDGYLALRQRAADVRGLDEKDGTTSPRITGNDALEIAAVFDPALQTHGTPGVIARWKVQLDALLHGAVFEPDEMYSGARALWSEIEMAVIFLDDVSAPMPSQSLWDALFAHIGARATRRNASAAIEDGPVAHFAGIKTYDELWNAQREYLANKRGADKVPPPAGMTGGVFTIPRTTNADVLQLAAYWTDALAKAKQVMGYDGVKAKWQAAIDDVNRIAKAGKVDDVYEQNNAFWRRALEVAIQIAIADEAPSEWDMIVDSVKAGVSHLPETLEGAAHKGGELLVDAAHAVGAAGRGLLSGLGAPAVIGASLVGLWLLAARKKAAA